MKKIILLIILLFIFCTSISAKSIKVKLDSCVDGDTAKFIYNETVIKARFLAIDTPETGFPSKEAQPFGKEAAQYTCERLTYAKKIILEFDSKSSEKDKYGRYLVWIFIDDSLLQKELVSKGYAKVAYLYDNYKYNNELKEIEEIAKDNKIGIWSIEETKEYEEKEKKDYKEIIILIGILIIYSIVNCTAKKVTKK